MSSRTGYTHHGLHVGHDKVLHYAGLSDGLSGGAIELTSVGAFANRRKVQVKEYSKRKFSRSKSVERGYSRLGEDRYNVAFNNCEHFVTWCITGAHDSSQVRRTASTAAIVGAVVAGRNVPAAFIARRIFAKVIGHSAPKLTHTVAASAGLATGSVGAGMASLTLGVVCAAAAPFLASLAITGGLRHGVKKVVHWIQV